MERLNKINYKDSASIENSLHRSDVEFEEESKKEKLQEVLVGQREKKSSSTNRRISIASKRRSLYKVKAGEINPAAVSLILSKLGADSLSQSKNELKYIDIVISLLVLTNIFISILDTETCLSYTEDYVKEQLLLLGDQSSFLTRTRPRRTCEFNHEP